MTILVKSRALSSYTGIDIKLFSFSKTFLFLIFSRVSLMNINLTSLILWLVISSIYLNILSPTL